MILFEFMCNNLKHQVTNELIPQTDAEQGATGALIIVAPRIGIAMNINVFIRSLLVSID